jgi:hypothetical protein
METYSFTAYNSFLPFVSLGLGLATFIILLNILWRVKNHLASFVKYLLLAVAVFNIRKILFILGFNENSWWSISLQVFDALMLLPAMLAVVQLYQIVKIADGEAGVPAGQLKQPERPVVRK